MIISTPSPATQLICYLMLVAMTGCDPSEESYPIDITSSAITLNHASSFADVLGDDLRGNIGGRPIQFGAYDIGPIILETGQIVACDGFILDGVPFTKKLIPGEYPVLILVAKVNQTETIAFARIQVKDAPVILWTSALTEGQDPSRLKTDEFFGYGVDSGTGAFLDETTLALLADEIVRGRDFFDRVIDAMQSRPGSSAAWAQIRTPRGSAVLFSSGYGDGAYPTYFGYDDSDEIAAVLTDFGVIDWKPAMQTK